MASYDERERIRPDKEREGEKRDRLNRGLSPLDFSSVEKERESV